MSGFKVFGMRGYSFSTKKEADDLRLKKLADAAWSVGYKRGFGPNDKCIVPRRYFEVDLFFIAGWKAGRKDYKKERE